MVGEKWACPRCALKKVESQVVLKQISPTQALYICEGKRCLYPLDALKKFPIVNREIGEIPVDDTLLRSLSLPLSLLEEEGLTEKHLEYLIELNTIKPQVKTIFKTKNAWEGHVKRMKEMGDPVPPELEQYRDADLATLQNIKPEYVRFARHIFNDKEEFACLNIW